MSNKRPENPYEPHPDNYTARNITKKGNPFFRLVQNSTFNGLTGCTIGLFCFAFGYPLLVSALELTLAPPLGAVENFGQFGFLIVYFVFFGVVGGSTCILVPMIRIRYWFVVYLFVTQLLFFSFLRVEMHSLFDVVNFAYIVICFVSAVIISCVLKAISEERKKT